MFPEGGETGGGRCGTFMATRFQCKATNGREIITMQFKYKIKEHGRHPPPLLLLICSGSFVCFFKILHRFCCMIDVFIPTRLYVHLHAEKCTRSEKEKATWERSDEHSAPSSSSSSSSSHTHTHAHAPSCGNKGYVCVCVRVCVCVCVCVCLVSICSHSQIKVASCAFRVSAILLYFLKKKTAATRDGVRRPDVSRSPVQPQRQTRGAGFHACHTF